MKIQQILSGPGKYLLLMTWWVFVFFAICLFSYPLTCYLISYIPFFVAFVLTLIFSLFLNLADGAFTFWRQMGHLGKFVTLMGFYSSTVIAILITCLILSSDGIISYFDGDRVGDFGWLYIPSIFLYGTVGMVLIFVLVAIEERKKRLSQKTPKRDVAKSRRVP